MLNKRLLERTLNFCENTSYETKCVGYGFTGCLLGFIESVTMKVPILTALGLGVGYLQFKGDTAKLTQEDLNKVNNDKRIFYSIVAGDLLFYSIKYHEQISGLLSNLTN